MISINSLQDTALEKHEGNSIASIYKPTKFIKEMYTNNYFKHYWWIILISVAILVLPVFLNFLVFKPVSQLSVGSLQDWMSFWGSYLGATISALVAFIILYIQRKDAEQHYRQVRKDEQMQLFRNNRIKEINEAINKSKEDEQKRQHQRNTIRYQQEAQWLTVLREALVKYVSIYQENRIIEIINSVQGCSFESVQLKLKHLHNTLSQADTEMELIISENRNSLIADDYYAELARKNALYTSIINDIQLLVCLYYNKVSLLNNNTDNVKKLIVEMGMDSRKIDYAQFLELAYKIIEPVQDICKAVRTISKSFIKDERQRVNFILENDL